MTSWTEYTKEWRVLQCTILQIQALPPGWWYDDHNRSPGMALVEWTIDYGDGEPPKTGRDVLPLSEDLQLECPIEGAWDGVQLLGDFSKFINYEPDHEPPL